MAAQVYRGERLTITVTMSPVESVVGWTTVFVLAGGLEKTGTVEDGPGGVLQFQLEAVDTDLVPGVYPYAVWRIDVNEEFVLSSGDLTVLSAPRVS